MGLVADHSHLTQNLKMSGAVSPLLHIPYILESNLH